MDGGSAPHGKAADAASPAADRLQQRLRAQVSGLRQRRRLRYGRHRLMSPLTRRILAVNLLALLMLAGSVLYLNRTKDWLISAEVKAMNDEARIFAAALAEGAVSLSLLDRYEIDPVRSVAMMQHLMAENPERIRLFDRHGGLMADSWSVTGSQQAVQHSTLLPPGAKPGVVDKLGREAEVLLDKLASLDPASGPARPPYMELPTQFADQYPHTWAALSGEAGSAVYVLADRRLLLSVAVPVQRFKQVLGVVMLSRTSENIDAAMRSARLDILRVAAATFAITTLLSLYLAGTIVRPIRRLAAAAERVRHGQGRQILIPDLTRRGDEIGDLSAALGEMTQALWARMDAIERFAADVSHEIKNPLTSLNSAVETLGFVTNPEAQKKLLRIIAQDVQRLDRLVTDISSASRLDSELSKARPEPLDVAAMLNMLRDSFDSRQRKGLDAEDAAPVAVTLALPPGVPLRIRGVETRLTQVIENLLSNALSFSPPGASVAMQARREGNSIVIAVSDDGPGIPEGKLEAIFDRFYTERPKGEAFGNHSGLGLSIARQIVTAHNGTIRAVNRYREDGSIAGATFTVVLPALDPAV